MTEVKIEYINEDKTEWFVDYGAKRRARYTWPKNEDITSTQWDLLVYLQLFVEREVNASTLGGMSEPKMYSLVEGLSRRFCGLHSPTECYGVKKSVIRYITLGVLKTIKEGGGRLLA